MVMSYCMRKQMIEPKWIYLKSVKTWRKRKNTILAPTTFSQNNTITSQRSRSNVFWLDCSHLRINPTHTHSTAEVFSRIEDTAPGPDKCCMKCVCKEGCVLWHAISVWLLHSGNQSLSPYIPAGVCCCGKWVTEGPSWVLFPKGC